ncbi:MAG: TetR/AcrR family transcriptional regulator [Corynebacterium sp.]|nr:TetR/AcrR family transcriptional regulator [Corynebacterium sp.]
MAKMGRRPSITRDRIISAGIAVTMPRLHVRAVAQELGVSEMSIYRHVKNLEGLRRMVAEGICERAEFAEPQSSDPKEGLLEHARYLRSFLREYPGIAEYLLQIAPTSRHILSMMDAHHQACAKAYGWDLGIASVVISAVSRYVVTLSVLEDRNLKVRPNDVPLLDQSEFPALGAGVIVGATLGDPLEYTVKALIEGLLQDFGLK